MKKKSLAERASEWAWVREKKCRPATVYDAYEAGYRDGRKADHRYGCTKRRRKP
jgi:hypothetical protein